MKNRLEIEAALCEAEAAFFEAATRATKLHGDGEQASAALEKTRATCLQLRTALNQLKRAEIIGETGGHEVEGVLAGSADIAREQSNGTCQAPNPSGDRVESDNRIAPHRGPRQRRSSNTVSIGRLKLDLVPASGRSRQQVQRQSISMLVLALAYLQYFYLDVQFQIVSLRSPFDGTSIALNIEATPQFVHMKS